MRNANCIYCGKELVANPNVCLESDATADCDGDLEGCYDCIKSRFCCSECEELLLVPRLELQVLVSEEQSLELRLEEVRSRTKSLTQMLER